MIKAAYVDLVARLVSMQKMHWVYIVAGAVSTGMAAHIPGTAVHDVISARATHSDTLITGNSYGPMEVAVSMERGTVKREDVYPTARKFWDGLYIFHIPK